MSERIRVGDLVQVVRWPCCGHALGAIFRVNEFTPAGIRPFQCVKCDAPHEHATVAASGWTKDDWSAPVPWIKRIPPLSELEGRTTEEGLRVPSKVKA